MTNYIKKTLKALYALINCLAYGGSIFLRNLLVVLIPTSMIMNCVTKSQLAVLVFYLFLTVASCKIMAESTKDSFLDSLLMKSKKENSDESYETKAKEKINTIDKVFSSIKSVSKFLLGAATTLTGVWLKDYAENNTLTDLITMVQSLIDNNMLEIFILSVYGLDFVFTVIQVVNKINIKYKAAKLEANDIVKKQEDLECEQIAERKKELTAIGQRILAK